MFNSSPPVLIMEDGNIFAVAVSSPAVKLVVAGDGNRSWPAGGSDYIQCEFEQPLSAFLD